MTIQEIRHRFRRSSIRTDKIEFDIGTWTIAGNDLPRLNLPLQTADFHPSYSTEPVQLFSNPSFSSNGMLRSIQFAQRASVTQIGSFDQSDRVSAPLPLFSGRLKFTHERSQLFPNVPSQIMHARVTASPLRISRYQNPEIDEPILFASRMQSLEGEEFSLDGRDNYIPRNLNFYRDSEIDWIQQVSGYLEGISNVLNEVITSLGRSLHEAPSTMDITQNVVLRNRNYIRLREVESVIEIFDDDPTLLVLRLEPVLASLGANVFANDYEISPRAPLERSVRGNSRSITVKLSNTKKLRVYAKTNRRVRFEVVHKIDSSQSRDLLGGGVTYEGANTRTQLEDWLTRIRDDASRYLTLVMDRLVDQSEPASSIGAPLYRFLLRLTALVGNEPDTELLLSLVINNHRLEPSSLPSHLRNLLNRQQRLSNPIFVRRIPRGPFVIASEYEQCIDLLRTGSATPQDQ